MRGLTPARGRARDDDGAVMVLVALALAAVLGVGMLVVDTGALWVARRAVVTAGQAVALAAAAGYAVGTAGCADVGLSGLAGENADTSSVECELESGDEDSGIASVTITSAEIPKVLSQLASSAPTRVTAEVWARWGSPSTAIGLRPVALCVDDEHVRGLLGTGDDGGVHPSPGVHRIAYPKAASADCGDAPGAFGFLDFDGGGQLADDLVRWMALGYPNPVAPDDCDANGMTGDRCPGYRTVPAEVSGALDALVDAGQPVVIALVDDVTRGPGGRFHYRVAGFAALIVRGHDAVASEPADRYLDVEFVQAVGQGQCCSTGLPDGGVRVVRLCAVDAMPDQGARCAA